MNAKVSRALAKKQDEVSLRSPKKTARTKTLKLRAKKSIRMFGRIQTENGNE